MSKLEDLANELLMQIFEYLGDYQVYRAFAKLNQRFHSLHLFSNLPINIDLSSMSPSQFMSYRGERVLPNLTRLRCLRLSNPFVFDQHVLSFSSATSLRTLIVENIPSNCMSTLLPQLDSLVHLHSLTIATLNSATSHNFVYERVFRLPRLKFCQLSLGMTLDTNIFSLASYRFSPIEHLIITDRTSPDRLQALLSYVPGLRRLSVCLSPSFTRLPQHGHVLEHLREVSLRLTSVLFNELEGLCKKAFRSVEVLRIEGSRPYLSANWWQHLISTHLINLRVFDLFLEFNEEHAGITPTITDEVEQFASPFWLEHQWLFEYQSEGGWFAYKRRFYSVNPYR